MNPDSHLHFFEAAIERIGGIGYLEFRVPLKGK